MRPPRREQLQGARLIWSPPDRELVGDPGLDADERERCAGFRLEIDAARHATGRLLAKREAAAMLGIDVARVRVRPDVGEFAGRPLLYVDDQPAALRVSITHAGEVVLVALAPRDCGVDVELEASLSSLEDGDLVFSAAERTLLARMPEHDRLGWATQRWTGKEAVLKAVGRGLYVDPASLSWSGLSIEDVIVVAGLRLRCWEVAAPTGYRASLAMVVGELRAGGGAAARAAGARRRRR